MLSFCRFSFAGGVFSYAIALLFLGSMLAEVFSDIGNALLLITACLLLFRIVAYCEFKRRMHLEELRGTRSESLYEED
jgi:uncharacterized membrane protein